MSKYDTEATTIAALTENKKPDCVEALTFEFQDARARLGLSLRESYYYAEAIHFLKDHDGINSQPEVREEYQSEDVIRASLQNDIDTDNHRGEAELWLRWYNTLLSWDVPFDLAFTMAAEAAEEEWNETHDLDEAVAIAQLQDVRTGGDKDLEELKETTIKHFYSLRNQGVSVRESLEQARAQAAHAAQLLLLFQLFGDSGGLN